jgi:GNAT superfamily N-acetyltransferase
VPLVIREAGADDSSAIARLLTELGYPSSAADVERRLGRLGPDDRVFLAELDDQVAGLAAIHVSPALELDGDAAKVSALVVDERYRRRGLGEALMARIEEEARRRGCAVLFLTTAERREDAHAFYRRIGLEETGRRFAKRLE